jgi:hypothetical protein
MGARWPWLAMAIAALGCETGTTTAPEIETRVVVHAVLDPGTVEQVVIIELTRKTRLVDTTIVSQNPIIASGGTPVSGAHVVITRVGGESIVATEDAGVRGTGIYRLRSVTSFTGPVNAPTGFLQLVPGAQYELRVTSTRGTVTGRTRMPRYTRPPETASRAFNVDRDTLRFDAAPNDAATAGYLLRHISQTGRATERYDRQLSVPLFLPSDPGDRRPWAFSFARDDVRPGTTQTFVVAAVDSNVFRYAVAGFDPFGDETQGNTLEGGVGLFGSTVLLVNRPLDLIADADKPVERDWAALGRTISLPTQLRVYESPRFPGISTDGTLFLSGTARATDGQTLVVSGTSDDVGLRFNFFTRGGAFLSSAIGQLTGTSLDLRDERTGEASGYRIR